MCAGALLYSIHPGRDDSGVVKDEAVTRVQIIYYVVKMTVLDRLFFSVEYHEPAAVALLKRSLRYQLLGKLVIKVCDLH